MEFKNLAEVELLGEVPEGASVLAATADGNVVRVPGDGLGGGGGGVVTAVIKSSDYDNAMAGVSAAAAVEPEPEVTLSANITFDEAMAAAASGGLSVVIMFVGGGVPVICQAMGTIVYLDVPELNIYSNIYSDIYQNGPIHWTPSGIANSVVNG